MCPAGYVGFPAYPAGHHLSFRYPLHGFHHNVVACVDNLEVFAHIPQVACHESLHLQSELRQSPFQFVFVLWLYLVFLRLFQHAVNHALRNLELFVELFE